MLTALIDADLVAYINSASAEQEPLDVALARVDKHMHDILEATNADQYKAFISGGNNFRYEVNPYYKANRTTPDPIHREACKDYLITEWKATVTDGYEADDALGINQNENTIICSIDKDLMMIPGLHYSWPILRKGVVIREESITQVSEIDGLRSFYRSMLVGDTSDNIVGVEKIGKVKAAKLIDPHTSEAGMYMTVLGLYDSNERFEMNADCLWIMQEEGVRFSDRYEDK